MKFKIILAVFVVLIIALLFPFYVGVGTWPELYDINIGQGMLQIWPADILLDMKPTLTIIMIAGFIGWEIIKNFRDGLNGRD